MEWWSDTSLTQLLLLVLAFVCSALVGLERHRRVRSTGMRTHALVGVGSAIFTLVSAYGFGSVIGSEVVLDPSRIAAQIVSGIGFLGGGVIFVRRDVVRGLTTAASIWVTAALGMACGAGMPVLAAGGTALYLGSTELLRLFANRVSPAGRKGAYFVRYEEGVGALRAILAVSAEFGFDVTLESVERVDEDGDPEIAAILHFAHGRIQGRDLVEHMISIDGVREFRIAATLEEERTL